MCCHVPALTNKCFSKTMSLDTSRVLKPCRSDPSQWTSTLLLVLLWYGCECRLLTLSCTLTALPPSARSSALAQAGTVFSVMHWSRNQVFYFTACCCCILCLSETSGIFTPYKNTKTLSNPMCRHLHFCVPCLSQASCVCAGARCWRIPWL